MNLAPYVDVEFGDEEAFRQFVFMHLVCHENLAEYVEDQGLSIENYPLDNWENQPDVLNFHNQVHIALANRLGLTAPQDLEKFNLHNETEFYDFSSLHGEEHRRLLLAAGF